MQPKTCFALIALAAPVLAQMPLRQDPNKVVAVVDGRDVTWGEVQRILAAAPPQLTTMFQQNPQNALMQWFIMQHLGREGEERKLDQKSPLKEQLEAMRMNYLADARLNEEFNAYPVTTDMIEDFYNQNRARYGRSRISGVYVKFKPEVKQGAVTPEDVAAAAQGILMGAGAQRTEAEARALAEEIARRLRAGESMKELSDEFSEDQAAKEKGGDIGYVTQTSDLPEPLRRAALALEAGAVSDPIRLPAGFYVIRVDEKGAQPLSQAAPEIIEEIRKRHLDEYMKSLNARFNPVIKDPTALVPMQRR
jgi:parvulin-like peptidyl-prolyl isomerase